MAHQIARDEALDLLAKVFPGAEDDYRENAAYSLPAEILAAIERLFESETQAYREALVGCAVARVLNQQIDVRYPATEHDENSFSGRSLSEQVIAPFLQEKAVPVSRSPYLSSLRGGARFIAGGEPRIQRDQAGFDALVAAVEHLRSLDVAEATAFLRDLLRLFVRLRESANIALTRIAEPKLEQLGRLIVGLLTVKSGGRLPAFLTTAMFQTLSDCHHLGWEVEFQGINVADKASGAVGDVTVKKDGKIVLGIEVTERPINAARVKATFEQKIVPGSVRDYLFVTTAEPEDAAKEAARNYSAVGHEMNFVNLKKWLIDNLATVGPDCRTIFEDKMLALLNAAGTPADLRVAWNVMMDAALNAKKP